MAQITSVTSEALQAKIRTLLPSQQGFGEDLQASNVILPVIDLTETAEGSGIPQFLQRAWDFSTAFYTTVGATTQTVVSNTGFWQFVVSVGYASSHTSFPRVYITDSLTVKPIWSVAGNAAAATPTAQTSDDEIVFLKAGESLVLQTYADQKAALWVRQVADVNGTLVNPSGFTPQ